MSIYLPEGRSSSEHQRLLEEALDDVGFLTEDDMIELMGGDSRLCDEHERYLARADLRAMGYREQTIALWGRRRVFHRWVKVAFSPTELTSRWGEEFVRKNGLG